MSILSRLPWALTLSRLLLAPLIVVLAWVDPEPRWFGACLGFAFLSDVFDGILARRLGVATPGLRRFDSWADTAFYVACTYVAWLLYPQVIAAHAGALVALVALELARHAFDLAKFGREASYHMWSSKAWGILLFAAFFALLAAGEADWLVPVAIYAGILADAEGLAISMVLRQWRADVPSIVHALRLRHEGH